MTAVGCAEPTAYSEQNLFDKLWNKLEKQFAGKMKHTDQEYIFESDGMNFKFNVVKDISDALVSTKPCGSASAGCFITYDDTKYYLDTFMLLKHLDVHYIHIGAIFCDVYSNRSVTPLLTGTELLETINVQRVKKAGKKTHNQFHIAKITGDWLQDKIAEWYRVMLAKAVADLTFATTSGNAKEVTTSASMGTKFGIIATWKASRASDKTEEVASSLLKSVLINELLELVHTYSRFVLVSFVCLFNFKYINEYIAVYYISAV